MTHTGTYRGLWAEPLVLILSCDWLEAIPSSPVEKCQGWIKGAASECPQLDVGFPGGSAKPQDLNIWGFVVAFNKAECNMLGYLAVKLV